MVELQIILLVQRRLFMPVRKGFLCRFWNRHRYNRYRKFHFLCWLCYNWHRKFHSHSIPKFFMKPWFHHRWHTLASPYVHRRCHLLPTLPLRSHSRGMLSHCPFLRLQYHFRQALLFQKCLGLRCRHSKYNKHIVILSQ